MVFALAGTLILAAYCFYWLRDTEVAKIELNENHEFVVVVYDDLSGPGLTVDFVITEKGTEKRREIGSLYGAYQLSDRKRIDQYITVIEVSKNRYHISSSKSHAEWDLLIDTELDQFIDYLK